MPPTTSSGCVVGSWLADNDAFLAAMGQSAGSNQIALASVTGAVRLDIGSDGALVETYDNWLQTYTLPGGAGPAFIAVTGVDTNTVVFAEDGTYSVTATQIGSHTKVWAADFVLVDGVSVLTMFIDSSAYTCSGDRLEIVTAAGTDFVEHDITMVFTRGG